MKNPIPDAVTSLNLPSLFAERFGGSCADSEAFVIWAPGRVNLIGEHTDYNDGYVLPMALDLGIALYGRVRADDTVRLFAEGPGEMAEFTLSAIEHSSTHPWLNYPMGVAKELIAHGALSADGQACLRGFDGVIHGTLPIGAGLSSSAALEVVSAYALLHVASHDIPKVDVVQICKRAENEFVGVNCGIMDQFIVLFAEPGTALFLDARTLLARHVPLPPAEQYEVVICDSHVKHSLASSEYNVRNRECKEALALLKQHLPHIHALRDVTPEQFRHYADSLPQPLRKRAEHVIYEIERTRQACDVLNAGDIAAFGKLMDESHASLRDLYEVSCSELDLLVDLAHMIPGVMGSRMTGGGFGGCTVSLVETARLGEFRATLPAAYKQATGIDCRIFVSSAAGGATVQAVAR